MTLSVDRILDVVTRTLARAQLMAAEVERSARRELLA